MRATIHVVPMEADSAWIIASNGRLVIWVNASLDPLTRRRYIHQAKREHGIGGHGALAPLLLVAAGIRRAVTHHKLAAIAAVGAASVTTAVAIPVSPPDVATAASRPPAAATHANPRPRVKARPMRQAPPQTDSGTGAQPSATSDATAPGATPAPAATVGKPTQAAKAKGAGHGKAPAVPPGLAKKQGKAKKHGKSGKAGKKAKEHPKHPKAPGRPSVVPSPHATR